MRAVLWTTLSLFTLLFATAVRSETIAVLLDQAKLVRLPPNVKTLVLGNPVIADATLLANGLMVLTGKGYGRTSIVAFDAAGAELLNEQIEVQGPAGYLSVVQRGPNRRTYSCGPTCEPRNTLGDGAEPTNSSSRTASAGGPCDKPDDRARDGSRCGERAASERPGGRDENSSSKEPKPEPR